MNRYKTNTLMALKNLKKAGFPNLKTITKSGNRINSVGESLEYYIKDMFADTFNIDDVEQKQTIYSTIFSYLGNQNNPPDFIVKKGDAIEVKKHIGIDSDIALNSSPPKDYLYSDDPRLIIACRNCEEWSKKDLAYFIGTTDADRLISLWIIYGNCYAADKEVYSRVEKGLVSGISNILDIEFAETRELARVNKVDPLGITDLRVRGMWHIESPNRVFSNIKKNYEGPALHTIMLKSKFIDLQDGMEEQEIADLKSGYVIKDVMINNPNNPAQQLEAVYISSALQVESELS